MGLKWNRVEVEESWIDDLGGKSVVTMVMMMYPPTLKYHKIYIQGHQQASEIGRSEEVQIYQH